MLMVLSAILMVICHITPLHTQTCIEAITVKLPRPMLSITNTSSFFVNNKKDKSHSTKLILQSTRLLYLVVFSRDAMKNVLYLGVPSTSLKYVPFLLPSLPFDRLVLGLP